MKNKNHAKVANLNRTTIIMITLLLLLSACVDPTPTPGSAVNAQSIEATATYGAEQFHIQLTARARGVTP